MRKIPIENLLTEEENTLLQKGMEFNATDAGNSERFIEKHSGACVFIQEYGRDGWFIWDGTRYVQAGQRILDLGKETVKKIYDEARDCPIDTGRSELTRWAKTSQARHKIEDMLKLASGQLQVSINCFDTSPELINCQNGVLSLSTGEMIAHDATQRFLKRAEAKYVPGLRCAKWEKFLGEIFLGDTDLIKYVKRALGYSLTGHTREHKLFIAFGGGSNGKTTLLETALKIMGDYGRVTQFANFLEEKTDVRSKEAVGMLKGARYALASETKSSKKWNEALVKQLTGGDSLTGARLRGDAYEFEPTHKLWFMANHLPGVRDASEGFWRRPVIIPFKKRFEGKSKKEGLKEWFLEHSRDAVFTWLIEGAIEYLKEGLAPLPQVCKDAIDKYRNDNDVLSRFISDKLVRETGATIGVKEVFDLYQNWCLANNLNDQMQIKYFSADMEERGIMRGPRRNSGEIFINCRRRSADFLQADNEDTEIDTNSKASNSSGIDLMRRMNIANG